MTIKNMAEKKPATASRRFAIGAAGAGVLALAAGGGWLLNKPAAPTEPATSSPLAHVLEQPLSMEGKIEPAAPPASAELPSRQTAAGVPSKQPEIDLRKVQLALEGNTSPADARQAASILSICQGANAAADMAYKLRDQGDATWRQLEKHTGFSAEKFIEVSQDTVRRCQVFDAATLARKGELLKHAYEGGAKDAALDYLVWLRAENKRAVDPALLSELQRDARRSAEDGNFEALVVFSQTFDPTLGITLVQRQAYKEARFLIEAETSGQAMATASREAMEKFEKAMTQWSPAPRTLSAEEQREADSVTARVLAAWRKHHGRGG